MYILFMPLHLTPLFMNTLLTLQLRNSYLVLMLNGEIFRSNCQMPMFTKGINGDFGM